MSKPSTRSYISDWGTPPDIVERSRALMGGIDLDPCSSEFRNTTIKATRYLTDGLSTPWIGPRIFVNPPGEAYRRFWDHLRPCMQDRGTQFVWLAYNMIQLATLSGTSLDKCSIAILKKRLSFLSVGGEPRGGTPCYSAIVYYNSELKPEHQRARLKTHFGDLGGVW
jgi:hypothetical protein